MTAAAHNMLRCLSHAEKASGRSFCSPYGAIVLVMPHNAPPLRSLLLALLLENKLLVSQRRAGGPWTHKCVRCGAPMRVAGRFHPTAGDKPAGEVGRVFRAVEEGFSTAAGCVWKVFSEVFCGWMDYTCHTIYWDSPSKCCLVALF